LRLRITQKPKAQNCRYYAPRQSTLIYINAVLDRIVGVWQMWGALSSRGMLQDLGTQAR
jgi:hypothetical protein